MTKSVGVVVALAALLACGIAAAQQDNEAEAKAQFDAGVELYQQGKYEQASVAFARAYELRPSFKILYLVGQCEDRLGHYAVSLDAYTRYLAEGGSLIDSARQDEVRKEIARLNALVGTVVVESNVKGLTVFVDDRRVGKTPLDTPVFLDLGEHTVQLKRGTTEVYREVVKVAGGQQVAVKVEVEGGDVTEEEEPAQPTAPEVKPKRLWTWVAFGVGGAAVIGAGITGGVFVSKSNDVKSQCDGNDCPSEVKGDADSAKALGNATSALVAVAAVGVAAGVVLYFVEPKLAKGERVEVAPVVAATPDGATLAIVGRF